MMMNVKSGARALLLGLALFGRAAAQDTFKYAGCADVTRANFTKVTIVDKTKNADLSEPVRFAIANNGDVYFAERSGGLKVAKTNGSIVKLGSVPSFPVDEKLKISGNNELGLTGLTLDPAFETNHWIYVDYQPPSPDIMNISRYTLNGDVLDLASEKIMLSFPMQKDYCCHTGGDMKFDAKGDLWISIGNNTRNPSNVSDPKGYVDESIPSADDQGHAANTNDYRGKILRIHPTADGKYTVPAGNFKDHFASIYDAAERAKIKPEIYTMGHRSNYTISVDNLKNLLAWGDIGPDEAFETEEFNITAKPGFMGWPYFAGAAGHAHYALRLNKDPAAPVNTSVNNTGVQKLPPAQPATIGYLKSAAITGPIYRYSSAQTSTKKVPPHFDGKWFIADFNAGYIHIVTLDDAGTKVMARNSLMTGLIRPLQITIGPDGVLYTLEYANTYFVTDGATRIARWDYTGPTCTSTSLGEQVGKAGSVKAGILLNLGMDNQRFVAVPAGTHGFGLYDLQGRLAWEYLVTTEGAHNVAIPSTLGNGLYRVKFEL